MPIASHQGRIRRDDNSVTLDQPVAFAGLRNPNLCSVAVFATVPLGRRRSRR
jgi:hypothetical protein